MPRWFTVPWKNVAIDDDLDALEACLAKALQPVEPCPEFVRDLRRRLINFPVPVPPANGSKLPQYIALTVASLVSGVAIVGVGVWVILALLGKQHEDEEGVGTSIRSVV